jgi:hypothetical protein
MTIRDASTFFQASLQLVFAALFIAPFLWINMNLFLILGSAVALGLLLFKDDKES